jgi:predicted transcriptional regulator
MRSFDEMRPPPDWMMTADLYILDLLDKVDIVLSPPVLAFELDYHGDYMSQRCRAMAKAGLIESVHEEKSGPYRITDLGRRYLDEDLSEEERERLDGFTVE